MNKLKIVFIFLMIVGSFSACEKDDICVDGDTPLLIIRFYDAENRTEPKVVPGLRILGIGNDALIDTFTDRSSSLDSIGIPLKTNDPTTAFSFIMDSADDDDGNEIGNTDLITFSYDINETFISRACGFVANYENLDTEFEGSDEDWIQEIEITTTTVELEETLTAHVKIFH